MVQQQQSPLISALLSGSFWPHEAETCRLIETHISWVLVAGDYAYKIKKPLDLGFLDFSTLDKRRYYCEEELRLNRRLAPDIYIEVVAIGGTPERPQLGAGKGVFEYAVKMRRFDDQAQLDLMLARGELGPSHIDAFAVMAADFHRQVEVAAAESAFGEPATVWQPVAENFHQIQQHLSGTEYEEQLSRLERWSHTQYDLLQGQLVERKRSGFVRECHGDMHLRNLAWIDGRALAFDCIEFNPALRWIDVISEIAFLVMDLDERGEPRLAQRFLNRYLEQSGDYEGIALLPFYLVYRALVRAKVAAIRAGQPDQNEQERSDALAEFVAYLNRAEAYTHLPSPFMIICRGVSGSGKSTVTSPLLEQLGAIRLRSDIERKRLFGLRPDEDGSAAPGEGIYSREAGERTYDRLAELARALLQAGYPVIIDAVCQYRAQRQRFIAVAEELGVAWLLLQFEAPEAELRQRVAMRHGDASDADLAVLAHQLESWAPLDEDERDCALLVASDGAAAGEKLYRQVLERVTR